MAMEDFRVDVVIGKGPGATAIPLDIPPFTLVGATTRAGLLPGPLRDRFGFTAHLEFYEPARARPDHPPLGRPARRRARGRRRRRDRLALARHAADRQPAAAPGPRLRPGPRRRRRHAPGRPGGARPLRGRPARPRPARPRRARRALPTLRRRPGRHLHARGRGRGGAGDRRGGRRAVPGPQRLPGAYAAGPGRHAGRVGAPRSSPPPAPPVPRTRPSSRTEVRRVVSHPDSWHADHPRGYTGPSVGPRLGRADALAFAREVLSSWSSCRSSASCCSSGSSSSGPPVRRQKELGRMQSSLTVGDEVMLTSGVFATVQCDRGRPRPASRSPRASIIKVARGAVGTRSSARGRGRAEPDRERWTSRGAAGSEEN